MSHSERLLRRLSDGKWHSAEELYYDLRVMVHSRVADLRRRGYLIDCERISGERGSRAYRYRLLSEAAPEPAVPHLGAASLSESLTEGDESAGQSGRASGAGALPGGDSREFTRRASHSPSVSEPVAGRGEALTADPPPRPLAQLSLEEAV